MSRFPYTAEDREDQVCQLIDARIHAIKHDIRANRVSTVEAVLERLDLGDFEGDALAERDVADMERRRAQSAQDARIEQRVWNHFFAHGVAA